MKWTNHSKLSKYGVQLRGWPANVPSQNPSTLTVAQNKLLLDLLRERNIYFVRTTSTQGSSPETSAETGGEVLQNADTMFEDTIDYSWNPDTHWNDAEPPVRSRLLQVGTKETDELNLGGRRHKQSLLGTIGVFAT